MIALVARDPCAVYPPQTAQATTKGLPVRVITNWQRNGLSDIAFDCRNYNAVNVAVYVGGTGPSATISVEGAEQEGATYLPLIDPNASQAVTAEVSFDCVIGTAWGRVRIADYVAGNFTVVVTPYLSPGLTRVEITSAVEVNESSGDGAFTTPTSNSVSIGITSTLALAANTSRKTVLLQNISDTDIWIALGGAAAVNTGFAKLVAYRGSYSMSAKEGNLYRGNIYAIHAGSGSKTLLVTEAT